MDQTTRRVAARFAADRAIFKVALEVYESLPFDIKNEVDEFLRGVFVGKAQSIESKAAELYELYEPVRKAVRSKYGAEVHLYRGEPTDKPHIVRRLLSWTTSFRLAAGFAEKKGFEVVEADVKVSDVAAVLVSPHNSDYIEYLVKDRKQYHDRGTLLPLVGGFSEQYPGPYTVPFDREAFAAWVEDTKRKMKAAIEGAGGKLLGFNVEEDDEYIVANVQMPSTTVLVDGHRAIVGPYVVEGLNPSAYRSRTGRYRQGLPLEDGEQPFLRLSSRGR